MALTKVQTIGIETGISLTGVTSAVNLNVTGITTVGVVSATSLNVSGVITATNFVGSGSQLTGVASTDNIRTNTNATFLQNINVTGIVTAAGVNASGVITATSFSGSGANLTGIAATADVRTNSLVVSGVSTVTDLRVGTAVTANSNGIQVGAGKSVRIFGSTSGFSDIIASSAAGASELTLPNTSGTLDRLNRAGNVLQVVEGTTTTHTTTTSTTFADTTLTANITPTTATNKVLVIISQQVVNDASTEATVGMAFKVLRGSTSLYDGTNNYDHYINASGGGVTSTQIVGRWNFTYLDSPSSTSSLTYKTQFKVIAANNSARAMVQVESSRSSITLIEVAA